MPASQQPDLIRILIRQGKQLFSRLKPYLRWVILGATLFFLASTLRQHGAEVAALRVDAIGWAILTVALAVTLLAHIWTGWVWSWILRELNQPASGSWGVLVYLKTNIAKYLPGNVWHLYGRIMAAKNAGFAAGAATLSVVLEPLLMAAAALTIVLLSLHSSYWWLQTLCLLGVLVVIHPRFLNPLLKFVSRIKKTSGAENPADRRQETADARQKDARQKDARQEPEDHSHLRSGVASSPSSVQLKRYPFLPLLGELIFIALRGIGFLLTVLVLTPFSLAQLPVIFSAFSFAWLLGLVIPGAPGGIGVFEATAIALLNSQLSPAVILGSVALYRLISTLAEAGGAGLAWLDESLMTQ